MKTIPLTKGRVATVDDSDYESLSKWKWCVSHYGYAVRSCRLPNGKRGIAFMHRIIMDAPIGQDVDHADGNGCNNQRSNLRFCTHAENMRNSKTPTTNTTGFKGAFFNKKKQCFESYIGFNGYHKYIGRFKTAELAHAAYCAAASKLHGEFARTQ